MNPTLLQRVEHWLAGDPDPDDRSELHALIDGGDEDALEARFSGPVSYTHLTLPTIYSV